MKRVIRLAANLYPRRWRERYAREFEALLDDVNPGWRDVFNVLNGAVMMQMNNVSVVLVVGGLIGAISGAVVCLPRPLKYEAAALLRLQLPDTRRTDAARDDAIVGSVTHALSRYPDARSAIQVRLLRDSVTSPLFRVSFVDADGAKAQQVVQQIIGVMAENGGIQPRAENAPRFDVIDAPTLPRHPLPSVRVAVIAVGCAIGLMVGGVGAWGRRRLRA